MLQTEHSIELLQTSYIERMCKDIFDIESENDSVTTPFDPKVNLSKDDVPASAAERAKLSQLPFRAACGKFIYLRHTKPECAYAISQVSVRIYTDKAGMAAVPAHRAVRLQHEASWCQVHSHDRRLGAPLRARLR